MYKPSPKILEKYSDVLVNFALNNGKGVKKDELVMLQVSESAKDFLPYLMKSIYGSGVHCLLEYMPEGIEQYYYRYADDRQLKFLPTKIFLEKAESIDHMLRILSLEDPCELSNIDPKKIILNKSSLKPFRDRLDTKENMGKFSWTLGLYGTEGMAKEAGISLKSCWEQIIKACYLDKLNPIDEWKRVYKKMELTRRTLSNLDIESLNIKGRGIDLNVKIGKKRKWVVSSGQNIPSFEVFVSPDWRGTEGMVEFNKPVYKDGILIEGIKLEFREGKVVRYSAKKNMKCLAALIKTKNGEKIGEFSLTDRRVSRIDKFMAHIMYDENFAGDNGNFHIALGKSFQESYAGDISKMKKKDWEDLGFNDSAVHTDIISSTSRVVTARLRSGKERVIYKDGCFVL